MRKLASPWDELPNESEQQLLMSFNQRMEIGFYHYFNRYFLLLFTYSLIKLKEKSVSAKIVNDSFTVIWTGKKTFETTDDLKHYLLLIVRNKCARHYHKARKEGKTLSPYRYHLGNSASDLEADKLLLDGLEKFFASRLPRELQQQQGVAPQ
jgi:DNA-directed RNA polymerase specialized sigma24 family protein